MEISNRKYWIESNNKKIADLKKPDAILSDKDTMRMDQILNEVEALRLPINRANASYKELANMDPTLSDYYKSGQILGEDYWGTPTELFARAFESYVEDKLKSNKRANTYLVDGTDNIYDTTKKVSITGTVQPYPRGEERRNINAAMDKLIATLKETKALEKSLQRFFIMGR